MQKRVLRIGWSAFDWTSLVAWQYVAAAGAAAAKPEMRRQSHFVATTPTITLNNKF